MMRLVAALAVIAFGCSTAAISQPAGQRLKLAQTSEAPKPSPEALKPVSGVPESTSETYGDWVLICSAAPSGRLCETDTTLTLRGQNTAVAKVAFARPVKDKPTHLIVVTPLNIQIAPGVKFEAENGKGAVTLAYRSCTSGGCFAESDVTADQVSAFRKSAGAGQITITDVGNKALALQISFRGLDQALDALAKK